MNNITIAGELYPVGSITTFDTQTESQLIATANADRNIDFSLIRTLPTLVAQSFAGWSRSSVNGTSDQSYIVIASIIIPGGLMGLNSKLVIIPDWDILSSTSTKYLSVDFGGQNISAPTATTSVMGKILIEVQNLNSLSSQKTMNGSSYGISSNVRIATSVDTSQDAAIDFKVKWGAAIAAETLTLLGYSIWHYPGN
ncbi:MAG: hypothetical protein ABI270_00825 [Nitrosospira sp.]